MTLEGTLAVDGSDKAAQLFVLGNLGVNLALSSTSSVFSTVDPVIVLVCNTTGTAGHIQAFASGDATATTSANGALIPAGGAQTFVVPVGFALRTSSATNLSIMKSRPGMGT